MQSTPSSAPWLRPFRRFRSFRQIRHRTVGSARELGGARVHRRRVAVPLLLFARKHYELRELQLGQPAQEWTDAGIVNNQGQQTRMAGDQLANLRQDRLRVLR